MYPDDFVQFLRDELYGLEWSGRDLQKNLDQIFSPGRGVVDLACLVGVGPWLRESDLPDVRVHRAPSSCDPFFEARACVRPERAT